LHYAKRVLTRERSDFELCCGGGSISDVKGSYGSRNWIGLTTACTPLNGDIGKQIDGLSWCCGIVRLDGKIGVTPQSNGLESSDRKGDIDKEISCIGGDGAIETCFNLPGILIGTINDYAGIIAVAIGNNMGKHWHWLLF
jgi:hypothetical protein